LNPEIDGFSLTRVGYCFSVRMVLIIVHKNRG